MPSWNVLLYANASNPLSIPGTWPAQVIPVPDGAPAPSAPWQRMTQAQYDAHLASAKPAFDAWAASRDAAEVTVKTTRAQVIADTISDIDLALANWDTLTNAQQKAVLRRVVVIIRAMLRDELR